MLAAPTAAWQLGVSRHAQRQQLLRMAVGQPQALATVVDPTTSAGTPARAEAVEPTASAAVPAVADAPLALPTKRQPKKVQAPEGPFAPIVLTAKSVLGDKRLNALRAEIILQHSQVIKKFVDTSDSPFGQLALRRLFALADRDGNGVLDKDEVRAALQALGFTFLKDKQVDGIISRADADQDELIDFEEFVLEVPRTLRTNLVKLAKQNGHQLGFLA
jgi:hypothetical protein